MKKYSVIILSILVAIAAVVLGVSQVFVGCDSVTEPDAASDVVGGEPYSVGPTTAPYVTPPTTQPPGQ